MPTTMPDHITPTAKNRPPQVTSGCWILVAAAVMVILTSFARAAGLDTLDSRERYAEIVKDDPYKSWGISVSDYVLGQFWLSVIVALSAAVIGICAWWMLKGDLASRWAATIAAVPLAIGGLFTGSFVAMLMVGFMAMLWAQPAKSWFAGLPIPERYLHPSARTQAAAHSAQATPPVPGQPPPPNQAALTHPQFAQAPPLLTRSVVLASAFASFTGFGALANLVALLTDPESVLDQMRDALPDSMTLTDSQLVSWGVGFSVFLALWSLLAVVFGIAAWRGKEWGRLALLGSCILTALVSVAAFATGTVAAVLPLLASGICARGLSAPEVKAFTRPPGLSGPGSSGPGSSGPADPSGPPNPPPPSDVRPPQ